MQNAELWCGARCAVLVLVVVMKQENGAERRRTIWLKWLVDNVTAIKCFNETLNSIHIDTRFTSDIVLH